MRDRIKELKRVPASLIDGAPFNWRQHPPEQRAAVKASLEELGIIDALKVREMPGGRFQVWDGNLREDLFMGVGPQTLVPILVTDLDEAEAKKANAVFDPLAAMARADAGKLESLLSELDAGNAALDAILRDVAESVGIYSVDGQAAPVLDDGEKAPFQQMTFTLHDSQADRVREALDQAIANETFDGSPNENSNGNALAALAEAYLGRG